MTRGGSGPPAARRRRRGEDSARPTVPLAPAGVLGDVAPSSEFDEWADRVIRQPALRHASRGSASSRPSELAIPIPDRVARSLGRSKEFEIVLEFPAPRVPFGERPVKTHEATDGGETHRSRHGLR
jgi:hypothetical protein